MNSGSKDVYEKSMNIMSINDDILSTIKFATKIRNADSSVQDQNFKISISDLSRFILMVYRPMIETTGRNVKFNSYQDSVVYCDVRILVKSVVGNLISNSCKYSKEDSNINISFIENSNWIELYIEDQGTPLTADILYDLDNGSAKVGANSINGYGLKAAKFFTESMGGIFNYDSSYNGGCRFIIRLPRTETLASHEIPDFISKKRHGCWRT